MTVLRHYKMQALPGQGGALATILADLAARVSPLKGCEKVELFADSKDADIFVFVEHWACVEDHQAAGAALGKEAFAPVLALLAIAPEGRYLKSLR